MRRTKRRPADRAGRQNNQGAVENSAGKATDRASEARRITYDLTDISVWEERPEPGGPPEPLPSAAQLATRTRDLLHRPQAVGWVERRYGLTPETLRAYEIGLEWRPSGPWLAIPIRDGDGALVNVRRRYVGRKPALHETGRKYRNLKGRGEPRLYLAHRLPPEGSPLVVCCGEFDALVFRQATGLAAVTSTGGANNWPAGREDLAERFDVTFAYDRGEEVYAELIARRLGARVASLPADLPHGTDLADLYRSGGAKTLRRLLRGSARRSA